MTTDLKSSKSPSSLAFSNCTPLLSYVASRQIHQSFPSHILTCKSSLTYSWLFATFHQSSWVVLDPFETDMRWSTQLKLIMIFPAQIQRHFRIFELITAPSNEIWSPSTPLCRTKAGTALELPNPCDVIGFDWLIVNVVSLS